MGKWIPFLLTRAKHFDYANEFPDKEAGGFSAYVSSPTLRREPEAVRKALNFLPRASKMTEEMRSVVPRALHVSQGHVHLLEFNVLRVRLGENFPFALDQGGRTIPYVYGLSAPIGTPVPSLAELESRSEEIRAEIERLVIGINERRNVQSEAIPFQFDGGNYGSGLWDTHAKAVSEGATVSKTVFAGVEKLNPDVYQYVPEGLFEGAGSKKNLAEKAASKLGEATKTGSIHISSEKLSSMRAASFARRPLTGFLVGVGMIGAAAAVVKLAGRGQRSASENGWQVHVRERSNSDRVAHSDVIAR